MKFTDLCRRTLRIGVATFLPWVALTVRATAADVTARMDAIVRQHVVTDDFSGAVLVAKSGATVFDRAYGLANREWDIPNTPTTHFRIGSITKQFTAVAVLLLEERGQLKLTDAVSAHLPDAPEAWRQITLHHLLTHTSGIPNVTRDPEFLLWKFQPSTARQMVGRFRERPLDFAPGERYAYSNSNYLVLGLLIELLSGQSFGDFLLENILHPLGLNNTGVDSNLEILPRRAGGYWRRNDRVVNAPYTDMSVPHASGAMYSTTHDLWRWAEAIFGDKLLTAASRSRLLTAVRENYALGVRVAEFQGRRLIEHGGNISGFSSFLRHYPEQGVTVVVLSNLTTGTSIVEEIAGKLGNALFESDLAGAPARVAITVPTGMLEAYCGVYDMGSGKKITFRLVDGALIAEPSGQPPLAVFAETETRFYFKTVATEVEFVRGPEGRVTHLLMKRDGRVREARRIPD